MPIGFRKLLIVSLSLVLLSGLALAQKDKEKKPKLTAPAVPEPAPRTPYSDVRRDSLLNGLQVIMLEQRDAPKVNCQLVIRGGAMFDVVGKAGLAQLTAESLLAVNPNLLQELESLDATLKWGVTLDTTWFQIEAPGGNLDQVLAIISRLLVVETVRKDAFEVAQKARLEKLQAMTLAPATKADEAFFATLYGDHPYGHNVAGTVASVGAVKYGDVLDFYKRVYLANNMFAVVRSHLRPERVMSLFRTFFGSWIKGVPPPPQFRPPFRTTEARVQKVEHPDLTNVEVRGGVIGVSHTDADFIATRLLALVLEPRLKKLEPSVTVQFAPRILAAPLYFSATVPADKAVAFSKQATDLFATLDKSEISEVELATAQTVLLKEAQERPIAEHLQEIATYKLPETYPLTYESRVKAVSTIDLQRVAKRLLEANALTVLVLGKVGDGAKS
ncbi:MAG TPA: pitrilysin family protein [Blastocatellia bacterium]|nr:pitrilysin family protein [Blastocatellia bacterium]